MITQESIDKILDATRIEDVIGEVVTLKKKGSNFQGCCPFHDENTPSFVVSPSKQMYKCFGCGAGGNVVTFLMENGRLEFPDAIHKLAAKYSMTVEETLANEEDKEVKEKRATMVDLNRFVQKSWVNNILGLPINHWSTTYLLEHRRLSMDTIVEWQIGYSPDAMKSITPHVLNNGQYAIAEELGLVKKNDNGNVYDTFINKIIFPIHNDRGEIIAFSGRKNDDGKKETPKYINSKTSLLYRKEEVLFGLWFAKQEIRKKRFAVLVEGNIDVIMMHQMGIRNTVATCGTALTESHAQKLARHCQNVTIFFDGDDAGHKATLKSIDILISAGLRVNVARPDKEDDPDTLCKVLGSELLPKDGEMPVKGLEGRKNPIDEWLENHTQDGVMWKAMYLLDHAKDDIHLKDQALADIAMTISLEQSDYLRESYIERISKAKKMKLGTLTKRVESLIEERVIQEERKQDQESILPSWINKEKFYTLGFDSKKDGIQHTGIYFHMGDKGAKQLTNFIIKPLIHVYSKDENANRRLTEVDNGISKTVLELPSKAFTSVDQFESILMNEGVYFLMDGFAKSQLNKLKSVLLREYPKCFELKTLGWQPEGFWSFYNRVYHNDSLHTFNEYGFTDVNGTNYLSMAASSLANEVRAEDDIYKNDRYLSWSPAPFTFSEWAEMFVGAYGLNAWTGLMFVFVSIFRDIVYALNSSCPHFYVYGSVGSGKSVFAESICNLFFKEMPFFNLNHGTDFAFFSRMERFRNCPVGFNEFDENTIKPEWFGGIKAGFDGEGREKGSMTKKKKTEVQEIYCTLILIGQFLSTKDDASVLSRSIPEQISATNRTQAQIDNFNRLKAWEKKGLSGILVELLQYRSLVESKYAEFYAQEFKKLSQAFETIGVRVKSRIQQNFCTMLTFRKLLDGMIDFPFSYDEFFNHVKRSIISLSQRITESDSLATFWKTLEFLLEQDMITDGWDFKIDVRDSVPLIISRADVGEDGKNTRVKTFEEPKKLLYIRMTNIHPLYMNATRQQTGKTGLNSETITNFMREQESYIGTIKSTVFKKKNGSSTPSSAFVFDYDMMNLNLEREVAPLGVQRVINGAVRYKDAAIVETLGETKVSWIMEIDESYEKEGFMVEKIIQVSCFSRKLDEVRRLTAGTPIKVEGLYTEYTAGDKRRGTMLVENIEFTEGPSVPVQDQVELFN
ncbi:MULTISPECIES: DNA primase [Sphingobacterium]|uniref:DNA primase n=1 Tax=Sphingobacterium TaxID=28453 RepID=UPI00258000C8|nr:MULTISPECIES: DNA primase [Sphingobacterium]